MTDKEYNDLINKWGKYGAIRSGLPFDTAVQFMFKIMDANDLIKITQASSSAISRMKNGKGSLKLEALQKVYKFYQDVSSMPVNGSMYNDTDLMALYSKKDVRDLLNKIKNAKAQVEATTDAMFRDIQTSLRSIRDQAPMKKANPDSLQSYQDNLKVDQEKQEDEGISNEVPPVEEIKNEDGDIYLTNDYEEFYLKPAYYDVNTMKKIMGYRGKLSSDFKMLTLRQRYLLEFATLIQTATLSEEDIKLCDEIHQSPRSFWTLHARYGMDDNEYLRQTYRGRKIPERSKPEYNNIEEAVAWVNYIEKWITNHPNFKDPNNDHSAEKHHIDIGNE